MFRTCWAGLSLPNTALPATIVSAPARVMMGTVVASMPPSTSRRWWKSSNFFSSSQRGGLFGMKLCPPKPGSTDISRTISTNSITGSRSETGVFGLMEIPTETLRSRRIFIISLGFVTASRWNVMPSAPAFTKSGAYLAGSEIIR